MSIDDLRGTAFRMQEDDFRKLGIESPDQIELRTTLPIPNELAQDSSFLKIIWDFGRSKLVGIYKKAKGSPVATLLCLFLTIPSVLSAVEFWHAHVYRPASDYICQVMDMEEPDIEYEADGDGYIVMADEEDWDERLGALPDEGSSSSSSSFSSSESSESVNLSGSVIVPASGVPAEIASHLVDVTDDVEA